jgi:hypothetical protein
MCEIDCIERTIQNDNIGGYVKVSNTLAPILDGLFVSFLAGWSVLKLFRFLAWWRHDTH